MDEQRNGRRTRGSRGLRWVLVGLAACIVAVALAGDAQLGASLYGLRFGDGTLVLATFEGYVLCTDLGAVEQALGSLDAQP